MLRTQNTAFTLDGTSLSSSKGAVYALMMCNQPPLDA